RQDVKKRFPLQFSPKFADQLQVQVVHHFDNKGMLPYDTHADGCVQHDRTQRLLAFLDSLQRTNLPRRLVTHDENSCDSAGLIPNRTVAKGPVNILYPTVSIDGN